MLRKPWLREGTPLWLWCRLTAAASIRPLAWELPYATGAALKKKKKKGERERERHPRTVCAQRGQVRSQQEGCYLQAGKSVLARNQPCWRIDLGLPPSKTVRKQDCLLLQQLFKLLVCSIFVFVGPQLRYMEVPRLGVESELQLPAYATAIAMPDPSHVCDLHYSSWQCQILNPVREARDRTCILMDTSQVC